MKVATWPHKRIDELCEITSSKRIFAADYVSEGVPFYRGREVTEKYKGNIDVSTELFITEEKFKEIERKFGAPKPGDMLLTSVGTLGSVYVVKNGDRFYFKDGNLTWFRNFKGLDSQFLYYWIGSPQGKAELQKCTIGSSQSAFTIVLLKGIEIDLPPLHIQRQIAGILSAYDELIENSQRRIKILESMARALYREWFVHFRFPGHESTPRIPSPLGNIPQGWEVKKLADFVELKSGFAFKSGTFTTDGQHRLVTIKNVQDGSFNPESDSRLSELPEKMPPYCVLSDGDILLSLTGNVGRVCLVFNSPFLLNQRVSKLVPLKPFDWSMAYCMFREPEMRTKLEMLSNGVAQQNLSPVLASQMELALPSLELRQKFASAAEPMIESIVQLYTKIQNLRRTRDLLLPQLLSKRAIPSQSDVRVNLNHTFGGQ